MPMKVGGTVVNSDVRICPFQARSKSQCGNTLEVGRVIPFNKNEVVSNFSTKTVGIYVICPDNSTSIGVNLAPGGGIGYEKFRNERCPHPNYDY